MPFRSDIASFSEEEFVGFRKAILEAALDAIVTIDEDDKIIEWNDLSTDLFGWSREEAIGQYMPEMILPKKYREAHQNGMKRYRETGVSTILKKRIELEAMDRLGRLFPVELGISPFKFQGKTFFTARLRDISDRKNYENQQKALIHEMNHRSKNLLAVATAMIRMTDAGTKEEYKNSVTSRIEALAGVHNDIVNNNWLGVSIKDIVEKQIKPEKHNRLHVEGPDILLNSTAAQSLGIAVHELATNAVKFGAHSNHYGYVEVRSWVEDENLVVEWFEFDGPSIKNPPQTKSFGMRMIDRQAQQVFGNATKIDWRETGLVCTYKIPMVMTVGYFGQN